MPNNDYMGRMWCVAFVEGSMKVGHNCGFLCPNSCTLPNWFMLWVIVARRSTSLPLILFWLCELNVQLLEVVSLLVHIVQRLFFRCISIRLLIFKTSRERY